ncbi:MAG: tRNA lysidine(34) synthetase TilS [Rubellimicrobium sp.]|nr:tRNA lysidine(34) synthetase TilS [Rubellimicrobium sp.]
MFLTPEAAFETALDRTPLLRPSRIGVAVSGGGDSLALMVLAADWTARHGVGLAAATVDHRLRTGSTTEAEGVAALCARLGIAHRILTWEGWDGHGNLQARARQARHHLLRGWAEGAGLAHVLLGHTADDQAETVLMNLARGSGVDGLSGMVTGRGLFLRPLLATRRSDLRALLRARGLEWAEDPSNDDPRFDRVKARRMMPDLAALGLTTERLALTAAHMARARRTLDRAAHAFATCHVRAEGGDLLLDPEVLALGDEDTPARVLSAALAWVGARDHRPRHAALTALAAALARGEARTLGGVLARPEKGGGARLMREARAAPVCAFPTGETAVRWDRRWLVEAPGPAPAGLTLGPLGADLSQCPGWRATGLSRTTLMASPALRAGAGLVAAPLAVPGSHWRARIVTDFHSDMLSH